MAENQGTLEISEKIHRQAEKENVIISKSSEYSLMFLPLSGAKKLPKLDHLLLDQSLGCHSGVTCETGYRQSKKNKDGIIKQNKFYI